MADFNLGDIEIDLTDPGSVNDALMKVIMIKNGLNNAAKAIQEYLLKEGVRVTKSKIVSLCNPDWNPADGDLYASVKSEAFVFDETTGKGTGYITAGDGLKTGKDGMSYAVYVEFGTGVSAENKKEEKKTNAHTTAWGTTLKLPPKKTETEKAEVSAKPQHFQDKEGNWHTIFGQPPKHFMRDAMYQVWQNAQEKWTELLKQYLPHETG